MWVQTTHEICVVPGCGGEVIEIWDQVCTVPPELMIIGPGSKDQFVNQLQSRCCVKCAVEYGFSRSGKNAEAIRQMHREAKTRETKDL